MSDSRPEGRNLGPFGAGRAMAEGVVHQIVNGVVRELDVNVIVGQVDIDDLLTRIDIDALLERIDMDALLERVDVDGIIKRVDLQALYGRHRSPGHRPPVHRRARQRLGEVRAGAHHERRRACSVGSSIGSCTAPSLDIPSCSPVAPARVAS